MLREHAKVYTFSDKSLRRAKYRSQKDSHNTNLSGMSNGRPQALSTNEREFPQTICLPSICAVPYLAILSLVKYVKIQVFDLLGW